MGILDRLTSSLGELIVPDDVRMHVELGAVSLERGDFDLAARELARAVALRPDHARAWLLLGLAEVRRNDSVAAEVALVQATRAREGFGEALLALGEVRRRAAKWEEAAEAFRRALDAGLDSAGSRGEAYRGIGAAHLALGRVDKAVRELRKATGEAPDDGEAQGLLGRALLARGDLATAEVSLVRASAAADATPGAAAVWAALGELRRRSGRREEAEQAFEQALEIDRRSVEARRGLAECALERGDAAGAHGHALAVLGEAPGRPEGHALQARSLALVKSFDLALQALERAIARSSGGERAGLEGEALQIALQAGLNARAARFAEAILAAVPSHPDALAAVALARLDEGDTAGAAATLDRVPPPGTIETQIARARVLIASRREVEAAVALRRAATQAADDPRPRALLGEALRSGREIAASDLQGLLRAAHRVVLASPELSDLAAQVTRIQEVTDRPLLITVMGEFNSGKSTFVNALLGEEVAPMGVTPTTATINVLRYGAERGGRVVYRDESTRDVAWDDVPGLLRGLDAAEARRIRLVEMLYPLETLLRVNIVDTPGLNSILPEHEETAREFVSQADAVVWLFSLGQAGKASEREALERIRREGKRALGVVNKIDRTDGEGLAEVLAHLQGSLGDLVEVLVPFSAREALLGRSDPERLARSNLAQLQAVLEARFFTAAKSIKHQSARRRLGALIDEAERRSQGLLADDRRRAIEEALLQTRERGLLLVRQFLGEERTRLMVDLDELWAEGAREALDFVRPRRYPFGSNQASSADRDFLVGLITEKLRRLGERSRSRVAVEAAQLAAPSRAWFSDEVGEETLRLLGEQVYGRHLAFARGFLQGGCSDAFFTRTLPKLELAESTIRRALEREMPGMEVLDAELLAPLRAWADQCVGGLVARLKRLAAEAALERFEIEARLLQPLAALRRALSDEAMRG